MVVSMYSTLRRRLLSIVIASRLAGVRLISYMSVLSCFMSHDEPLSAAQISRVESSFCTTKALYRYALSSVTCSINSSLIHTRNSSGSAKCAIATQSVEALRDLKRWVINMVRAEWELAATAKVGVRSRALRLAPW